MTDSPPPARQAPPADAVPGPATDAAAAEPSDTLRDSSGRRIAIEPPAWDLLPPAETETVGRYRPQ
jgi:hypothetical protein